MLRFYGIYICFFWSSLNDIVVGAPMFIDEEKTTNGWEIGKVYIYYNDGSVSRKIVLYVLYKSLTRWWIMMCYKNGFKDVANSGRVFKSRDRALILRNALAPASAVHLTCNACLFVLNIVNVLNACCTAANAWRNVYY